MLGLLVFFVVMWFIFRVGFIVVCTFINDPVTWGCGFFMMVMAIFLFLALIIAFM